MSTSFNRNYYDFYSWIFIPFTLGDNGISFCHFWQASGTSGISGVTVQYNPCRWNVEGCSAILSFFCSAILIFHHGSLGTMEFIECIDQKAFIFSMCSVWMGHWATVDWIVGHHSVHRRREYQIPSNIIVKISLFVRNILCLLKFICVFNAALRVKNEFAFVFLSRRTTSRTYAAVGNLLRGDYKARCVHIDK